MIIALRLDGGVHGCYGALGRLGGKRGVAFLGWRLDMELGR